MSGNNSVNRSVFLARYLGRILGSLLIGAALFLVWRGIDQGRVFDLFQGFLFTVLGILYVLPWLRLSRRRWRKCFGLLLVMTAVLAFTQVLAVMVTFAEAARQGVKPGPPIFQGVILFLVLMQPAVIFFERHPDCWE